MLHKHLLNFTRKYNKEFAIKNYSKLKKADLQQKIESVLNKQRTEIKEEYKQLKMMKAEPAKKTPVKKPAPKKETKPKPAPVKKPAPKKEIKPKPAPVKKETKPKPAPKKEYKFTNQDIKRLKDWADLHKRKYSTMDTIYKKEILFELKRNDIFRKLKPKTDAEYKKLDEEEDKLIDKMYPEEAEEEKPAPKKAEPKKETKKEPVKKNDIDLKLLTPSGKKRYEEAIKDINEFSNELKIIEKNMKKGNLSKFTKEYYEDRIKLANKRISMAEKDITKLKNSIKASNKREEKINEFEKEGYKKVLENHEKIFEKVKKINNINENEFNKLGEEITKNISMMKKGYYKDDKIKEKFNKLTREINKLMKQKMPKEKEKKEIKPTGRSIKITGDEILKRVKDIKKAEPKKDKEELKLYSIPILSKKEDNPAMVKFKGKITKIENLEEDANYWLNIMKNKNLTVNMNENIKNNKWIGTDDWEHHQLIIDYLVGVILQTYKLDNTLNKKINDIKNKKSMEYIKKKVKDKYSNYCLNQMKDAEKLIKEKNKYKLNDIKKNELKELEKRIIELKKECKKSDDLFNELFKQSPKKEETKKEEPKKEPPKRNEKIDDLVFKTENNNMDNYNTLIKFLQKTKDKNIFPLELTFAFTQKQNEENFKALNSDPKLFMDFMAEIAKGIKDNNDLNFNILKKYDKKPSNMFVKS
jgi:hypothetical protein